MHGFLLLGMQLGPAHVGFTTEACLPSPPAGWVQYELTVCLQGGLKSDCRKVPCTTPQACALTGLTPSTKYDVTAVAFKADNSPSLASNSVTVTTSAFPTGQGRSRRPLPPPRHISRRDEVEDGLADLLAQPGPALLHVTIDIKANVWPLVPPNHANSSMLDASPATPSAEPAVAADGTEKKNALPA